MLRAHDARLQALVEELHRVETLLEMIRAVWALVRWVAVLVPYETPVRLLQQLTGIAVAPGNETGPHRGLDSRFIDFWLYRGVGYSPSSLAVFRLNLSSQQT
jgi:hypothetical protein